MKYVALIMAALLLPLAADAQALREATPQQQLLTTCRYEADAREMKGNEKSRFVSTCLAEGRQRQVGIQKECNAEARGKTGDARRAFMHECSRR
jgi:psiF repeat